MQTHRAWKLVMRRGCAPVKRDVLNQEPGMAPSSRLLETSTSDVL